MQYLHAHMRACVTHQADEVRAGEVPYGVNSKSATGLRPLSQLDAHADSQPSSIMQAWTYTQRRCRLAMRIVGHWMARLAQNGQSSHYAMLLPAPAAILKCKASTRQVRIVWSYDDNQRAPVGIAQDTFLWAAACVEN